MPSEHALIIRFQYGQPTLDPLFELEERLETAVEEAGAGEFDGNEISMDQADGTLYLYGPDADRLLDAVRPILEATPFLKGAEVLRRYGPAEEGVRTETLELPR